MSISDYDPSAGAATPRPLGRTCAAGEGRNRCALSSIPDGDPAAGAATPQPIGHACGSALTFNAESRIVLYSASKDPHLTSGPFAMCDDEDRTVAHIQLPPGGQAQIQHVVYTSRRRPHPASRGQAQIQHV
eukprot:scaffold39945_cov18-Tisochrysis_lutea.AAC.1